MNPPKQNIYKLGPGIRNICDELLNEITKAVGDLAKSKAEQSVKIRDFKDKIKTNFHPVLRQVIKTLKNYIKLDEGNTAIRCLNDFYLIIDRITMNLSFLNLMNDIYIFPEFNIYDTIDFIFEGCSNNLRQKLIDFPQLFDCVISKNLNDKNDVRFLLNNDLNFNDYNQEEKDNNINILLDKNNQITKDIIKRISNKINEFNNYIISNKDGFNEDNFKLYFDDLICLKLYNNFDIKFTIIQLNNIYYIILPVEIQYNNQKINLNDKDEKFYPKNRFLSKNDLYFLIDKFKPPKSEYINNEKVIMTFSKTDFLNKCLLFKEFTIELFNNKFENIKREIKNFLGKYDLPIKLEEKSNTKMEIESKDNTNEEYSINEATIFYNFSVTMKNKNEFYIKLIYDKEYPTCVKIVYSHFILKDNDIIVQKIGNIIIEEKESIVNLDLNYIKNEIFKMFEIYKRILLNWIGKKLDYIYQIHFDTNFFIKSSEKIIFRMRMRMKNIEKFIKYFSLFINSKGKLSYENLFTSQIITDNFKEINNIITNYLKCDDDDEKFNDYIIQFNDYIKRIIIEKVFLFTEDKIKLKELDSNTKKMILHVYNNYGTDKNISTYFEIRANILQSKYIFNLFQLEDVKIICSNNKDNNKKIIFNCDCQKYKKLIVDFSSSYEIFFRKVINELKTNYELCAIYAYDILKLTENITTNLELKNPFIINDTISNNSKEEAQWIELINENNSINLLKKEFNDKLIKYFTKILISRENNIFKLYLNPNIFKCKYSNIPNFLFDKYAALLQNIILSYDKNDDTISITIFGKMKMGYSNKIQIVFDDILPKLISFMNNIFKLIDFLLKNDHVPVMRVCPLYMSLQLTYGNNFKEHLNFKFQFEREPYFATDGNLNNIFYMFFVRQFGEELLLQDIDYNDKDYLKKKEKYFYINYKIYDSLINKYKFKISMIEYPYNHFDEMNSNIYCIIKDFNLINLMSLNNFVLSLQIRNDNSIYMEFRDKINLDIENNMYSLFFQKIKETNLEFKMNFEKKNGYGNIFILLDEDNDEDKFSKFDKIINIIISLSKIN